MVICFTDLESAGIRENEKAGEMFSGRGTVSTGKEFFFENREYPLDATSHGEIPEPLLPIPFRDCIFTLFVVYYCEYTGSEYQDIPKRDTGL